jgi:thioredoxin reductase-like selenoprotein T
MQLKMFLEQKFPHLHGSIDGENYPPPATNVLIANTIGLLQSLGFFFLLGGEFICGLLGIALSDGVKNYLSENKMMLFMCLFFCNSLAQSLISTGAFEVEYNGSVVFSKLEMGRMPSLEELMVNFGKAGLKPYQAS